MPAEVIPADGFMVWSADAPGRVPRNTSMDAPSALDPTADFSEMIAISAAIVATVHAFKVKIWPGGYELGSIHFIHLPCG